MPPLVKLLVVHNHTLFCERFLELFKNANGISEVRHASCASKAFELLNEVKFQILFLYDVLEDAEMPPFIRKVKSKFAGISIILFSMNKDIAYVKNMKKAGVKGFVDVSARGRVIKNSIESVAEGNMHFCPVYSNVIGGDREMEVFEIPDPVTLFGFTEKEFEVFKLKANRKSLAEIGMILNWKESTTKEYSSKVLNKVRSKNYKDEMDFVLQTGYSV